MFEVGEEVIYFTNNDIIKNLTIGKTYNILSKYRGMIYVRNDVGNKHLYSQERFITIEEYRRLKIEKICSKLEI